uniref:Uncharacterized protein n=1 Tax=Arundo donax TaxID=35708 RepID=A0A0A9EGE5_ARUDO
MASMLSGYPHGSSFLTHQCSYMIFAYARK